MSNKLHKGQIVEILNAKGDGYEKAVVVNPSTKSPLSERPAIAVVPYRATMWVSADLIKNTKEPA